MSINLNGDELDSNIEDGECNCAACREQHEYQVSLHAPCTISTTQSGFGEPSTTSFEVPSLGVAILCVDRFVSQGHAFDGQSGVHHWQHVEPGLAWRGVDLRIAVDVNRSFEATFGE